MIYTSQDLHKSPPNLSYTNTSKLTWNKPLLKIIQSVFNSYHIPLFEAKKKKKKRKNSHLFGSRNHFLQINSYLFA